MNTSTHMSIKTISITQKSVMLSLIVNGMSALLTSSLVFAQPVPPCGDNYGSPFDRGAIELAMFSGTEQDVIDAINSAKATRGNRVGCAEAIVTRVTPDFAEPTLASVAQIWETIHAPALAGLGSGCPDLGRRLPTVTLGSYYAGLAGYSSDPILLKTTAQTIEAQQYSAERAPIPLVTEPGMFAYLHTVPTDSCYVGGIVGLAVETICSMLPHLCVTYSAGPFAGLEFLVADTEPDSLFFDGGAAYDHGWSGVMMIKAATQQTDPTLRDIYRASALLSGQWAAIEPPVRNHNYTAKLVWLLAELYNWTGDTTFRDAMLDKLARNLKPGLLMDVDSDGFVDGMSNQPFSGLDTVAQRPGRNWDGHNALPWYHGMIATALTEAYVSLRDRGDTGEAMSLRPYVIASLDNLAWGINNLGVPQNIPRSIPYPFLVALWKIADYENEPRPEWQQAAWALWNSGIGDSFGDHTVNTGLFLLYKSGLPYSPPNDCCTIPGDFNHDATFNIADVTAGITRIFSGGPAPACQDAADANGDNSFNIADVTFGIARIFSGGPAPVCGTTET